VIPLKTGERIRFYREKQDMTQAMLSQITGIPLSSIKKYEACSRRPKRDALEKIALALNVSPNTFYDLRSETVGDLVALFFLLSQKGDIQFHGQRNADGKFDSDTVTFSFASPALKDFSKEWADTLEIINTLKLQAQNCPDEISQNMLLSRAVDMQIEAEYKHLSSQLPISENTHK